MKCIYSVNRDHVEDVWHHHEFIPCENEATRFFLSDPETLIVGYHMEIIGCIAVCEEHIRGIGEKTEVTKEEYEPMLEIRKNEQEAYLVVEI